MPTTTGFLEHNGGKLYWEAAGAGPAVALVHGFSLDTRMWDDQFGVPAERFRVVRYDARGFGKSTTPTGPFTHMDDLAALLDAQRMDRASVVGLSMGGRIAADFALTHPHRLAKLVLMDAVISGQTMSPEFNQMNADLRANARAGHVNSTKELWVRSPLFAPAAAIPAVRARLRTIVHDWSGWQWVSADPQLPLDPPAWGRLGDIAAETLVLVGELDLPDFHIGADRVAATAPHARKVVIPGAGHMCNMETPAAVNAELLAFLG